MNHLLIKLKLRLNLNFKRLKNQDMKLNNRKRQNYSKSQNNLKKNYKIILEIKNFTYSYNKKFQKVFEKLFI